MEDEAVMVVISKNAAEPVHDPDRTVRLARTSPEPSIVRALRETGVSNREAARMLGVEEAAVRQGKVALFDGRFSSLPIEVRARFLELEAVRLRGERERGPVSSVSTVTLAAVCASKAGHTCHLAVVSNADGVETEAELRETLRGFADARKAAEIGERATAQRLAEAVAARKAAGGNR